jgi:DNA-binding LacI/PurR family transcriptional regulator
MQYFARAGIPVVLTGYKDTTFNVVDIDNLAGGRQATNSFITNGHRCIGTITGPHLSLAAQERLRGYQEALTSAGISYGEDLIVEGDFRFRSGYEAMKVLLSRREPGKPFISSVFIQNDQMAIGALQAIHEVGLRVPNDISIIGYDDIPEAEFADPPLTTMRQPMMTVGAEAIRLLVRHIENPDLAPEQLYLGTELIWRQSVRKIDG